ncbi:unnamed protein product [Mytilus coruscus]|uniref:CCHC-type domain-containing protein n=1 Tax=Mytilus coruscus TaxID=42192 RepID=A0A6J8EIL1_MYTCO|nr:unnamed protein product [Mytilus coruscus]
MLQFQNSRQEQRESLKDRADTIMFLATKAFRQLPDEYIIKQAILRFCQGCTDRDAGQHACNARPISMEAAADTIKWFQHNKQAANLIDISEREPVEILTASEPADTDRIILENQISDIFTSLKTLTTYMGYKSDNSPQCSRDTQQRRNSGSQSPRASGNRRNQSGNRGYNKKFPGKCYRCDQRGHMVRDCPEPPPSLDKKTQKKQTSFKDDVVYPGDKVDATASVNQLGSARMLKLNIQIQGKHVNAIVDIGAQVTILYDRIFDMLEFKP